MARKFADLASEIVAKHFVDTRDVDAKITRKTEKKIKKLADTEERKKRCKPFMEIWNKWRWFYLEMPSLEPKNAQQLSAIENAIAYCEEEQFDLNMMVACIHRSYIWRTVRPAYTSILSHGDECYNQHYGNVLADLDRIEYEDKARKNNR